jgi:hypothetical protein
MVVRDVEFLFSTKIWQNICCRNGTMDSSLASGCFGWSVCFDRDVVSRALCMSVLAHNNALVPTADASAQLNVILDEIPDYLKVI